MMKFLTPWGIATLVSQTTTVFECRRMGKKQALEITKEVEPQEEVSLTKEVLVNPAYLGQLVTIGKNPSLEGSAQLKALLKKNIDVFTWELSDMIGYRQMSFGLKNARATYQRLVDTAFQSQIRRNLEAYVDDMVVKSKTEKEMIADIAETIDNLRQINVKLNLKNAHLGGGEENAWIHWSRQKGIWANPCQDKRHS
ncbi:reverse transcriptase domain-containing protein [Tanacetum coccineum]